MGGPVIAAALDDLLGGDGWTPPRTFGNVLVTMPNTTAWRVPHKIWHSDFEATAPCDELFAVKVWALFDDVEAGGGGTPQLLGSHRLFARYLTTTDDHDYKAAKFGFLRSHPWLRSLTQDVGDPDRNERFMAADTAVDGVALRVVECTGRAGDVYLTHPWVFHSIAANAQRRPRLMRSFAVRRR
jgi:ectoine hydroxylase-related dioxygenase (phytanoyl-CoA dioxygenase family)